MDPDSAVSQRSSRQFPEKCRKESIIEQLENVRELSNIFFKIGKSSNIYQAPELSQDPVQILGIMDFAVCAVLQAVRECPWNRLNGVFCCFPENC